MGSVPGLGFRSGVVDAVDEPGRGCVEIRFSLAYGLI